MKYFCCDERRRQVVKELGTLNGLEYLEVIDRAAPSEALRQRTLVVKFLRPPGALDVHNFRVAGGVRVETVAIEWVASATALPAGESPTLVDGLAPLDEFLLIRTESSGDFSVYTLRLVAGPGDDAPPAGFDPRLTEVAFSFKVECESPFDCATTATCPAPARETPRLNYLARDYGSFRRLLLDRATALVPDWRERNPADLGVTLIELLAYVGDHLAYQQDAIGTEAYLATARRRVSLRRHARLMDYAVHEGCNARAWVRVRISDDAVPLARHTPLLTRVPGLPDRFVVGSPDHRDALARGAVTFETVDDAVLYAEHDRLEFYTWGDRGCCLRKGATAATLAGHRRKLKAGDVLVFVEEIGPATGTVEDADRGHRWAVRLTHVRLDEDPSGGLFLENPSNIAVEVTEIQWAAEDALPFPLCLSSVTDADHGAQYLPAVSAAYGNIVLADHGRTIEDESLGEVPLPRLRRPPEAAECGCEHAAKAEVPARYRPRLAERPLTHAVAQVPARLFVRTSTPALEADLDAGTFSPALHDWLQSNGIVFRLGPVVVQGGDGLWSIADGEQAFGVRKEEGMLALHAQPIAATRATSAAPREARPAIALEGELPGVNQPAESWRARPDLLSSGAEATEFVVEVEHDGTAALRFGDDVHGRRPNAGTSFRAAYRVGNGAAGNVGAESIVHIASSEARLTGVSNPLPAEGGVEPETAAAIRRDAPEAFRIQQRAVTQEDYAEVAGRHPAVQRAAATFRWTGSWHTVFLTVDRKGGGEIDAAFESEMRAHVERYRMAGYDLEVDGPRYVPLEVAMRVCARSDYFRADVRAALLRVFSAGWLPDGRAALFNPDRFTFGQPVYLSALYAAAQAVEGVASVAIDTFRKLHEPSATPLDVGYIGLGRLEIARLDNDPNFPERGVFDLTVGGGK